MATEHRSSCPINLTLEVLGDRWSLLVIRDLAFGGPRHFRQLMQGGEGISSNILTDRLERLTREGLLTGSADPTHSQRIIHHLTEKGVDLVPVLIQLGVWGSRHTRCSDPLAEQGRLLDAGGPPLWEVVQQEVRRIHVDRAPQDGAGPLQKALEPGSGPAEPILPVRRSSGPGIEVSAANLDDLAPNRSGLTTGR